MREAILNSPTWEQARLRPRLGITGSFGRGNYGDELYVKVYQHWFGRWADLFLLTGTFRPNYFSDLHNSFVDLMDAVVLGGGDLLCPYRPKVDPDFINPAYLRRPVHVAGIGVERNKPDVDSEVLSVWRNFLTHKNVASISTRDPGSKTWIEDNIEPSIPVSNHPDWACALPLPPVVKSKGPPIVSLVTRHIKSPKEYILMGEVSRNLAARGWRVVHIIGGVGAHGRKDYENALLLDIPGKEIVYSEDLDDITRAIGQSSLLLSMKLHTTIIGTMYGIPTICMNPVVKARAFMKAAGCEKFVVDANDKVVFDMVNAGVPSPSAERVSQLRVSAEEALRSLSIQIWTAFRESSTIRKDLLPEVPDML